MADNIFMQMSCLVTSTYDGPDGAPETIRFSLGEEARESPDGSARPFLRLQVSGDEVRRTVDGDPVSHDDPVAVVLPATALPALARGIEHVCMGAVKHQMSLLKATTTALHALLPLLSVDAVALIARNLVVARETGDADAVYLLRTLVACELAAATPREAVARVLLDAMGVDLSNVRQPQEEEP